VILLAIGLFLILFYALLCWIARNDEQFRTNWPAVVGMGLFVGGPALLMVRSAFCGVVLKPEGVLVRNPLRTHAFGWDEVQGFSIGTRSMYPKIGLLHLTDGREVRLFGIQGPNPDVRPGAHEAEDLIAELNEAMAIATTPAMGSAGSLTPH
jgi:Bacterial PH domain